MGLRKWMTAMALGAGLMYFYDPEHGNRRRALLRDRLMYWQNEMQDFRGKSTHDLQNRAEEAQVRSRSMAEDVSEIRGMQRNWSPGLRLVAGLAGGGLTFYGVGRLGIEGAAATAVGLNLLSRGLANAGLRDLAGMDNHGHTVDLQKTVTIDAPVDEVFDFWRNYHNFPSFMAHVQEVRDMGNGRSHWVVKGPAGKPVQWDAVVTELAPDHMLSWESLPGSAVYNSGRVRFEKMGDHTRIDVHISYRPPAGVLGYAVASLFGTDPKSALDDDMLRLKALIEHGKTTAGGQTVTSRQGQTDTVGRSGVYPASEPDAPPDAEVQGMASWGQRERGAAGYEDSGRSELHLGEETSESEKRASGTQKPQGDNQ